MERLKEDDANKILPIPSLQTLCAEISHGKEIFESGADKVLSSL